jgi:signal-transduction protein with cAMP-binding, CBS, and nucleotidyltransferase domain
MRISEVMRTPAVTCRSSMSLGEVARLMSDRNVGSVLVIDQIGYLAGIVTDRDLAVRGLGRGRSADVSVDQVMTRDVATVSLHADVSDVASIMAKRAVRRVPVVDEHDQPHGIVTLDDLVRHLGTEADALSDTVLSQSRNIAML